MQLTKIQKAYVVLACSFCVAIVVANIVGLKIFQIPGTTLALTTGMLIYPLTFVISDVTTEIYGSRSARLIVIVGFIISLCIAAVIKCALSLPAHPTWFVENNPFAFTSIEHYQTAYEFVFGASMIAIFSSLFAYLAGQLVDIALFQKIKEATGGKHLWLRNNLSTIAAQGIDTMIVSFIVLMGPLGLSFAAALKIVLTIFIYKAAMSIVLTPVIYFLVALLKKWQLQESESLQNP